jgi:hypothetical protein
VGLVATEVVRRQIPGESRLGLLDDAGWHDVSTLAEAHLFPGLLVPEVAAGNVAKKVLRRWYAGATDDVESLVALWGGLQGSLAPRGEAAPARGAEERLRWGLQIAGRQLVLMLCNLDEGTACLPTMWVLAGGRVQMSYLDVPTSGHAEAAFAQHLQSLGGADSASLVYDALFDGTDALCIRVAVPGTSTSASLVVPYAADAQGAIQFPRSPLLLRCHGAALEQDDALSALFTDALTLPEPVVARLAEQVAS